MSDLDRLRRAYAARSGDRVPGPACASPGEIWAAGRGEAAPARVRDLLEHARGCAACGELWTLAAEIGGTRAEAARPPRRVVGRGVAVAAAAAVLIAVVAASVWMRDRAPAGAPAVREAGAPAIDTLVPEDVVLPREGAVLRWTPGPDGTSWDVQVADENLEPLFERTGLGDSEVALPPGTLASVAPGDLILWRVEAVRPDGSRIASPTFRHRVE